MPGDQEIPPLPQKGQVSLVSPDGKLQDFLPSDVSTMLTAGYKIASPEAAEKNFKERVEARKGAIWKTHADESEKIRQEAMGPLSGALGAGTLGYVSGMTGGLGPSLLAKASGGGDFAKKMYSETQKAHPTASTVGEVGGFLGGTVIGEGAIGAAAGGLGLAGKGATTLAGKLGQTFVRGGLENAAFGAQHDINESLLEDKPLAAEHFIADRGLDFVVGGGFGAGMHAGVEGAKALGRGAKQVATWAGKEVGSIDGFANKLATRATKVSPDVYGKGGVFQPEVEQYVGEKLLPEVKFGGGKKEIYEIAKTKHGNVWSLIDESTKAAGQTQRSIIEPHIKEIDTLKREIPSLGERLQLLESLPSEERALRAATIQETREALTEAVTKRETLKSVEEAQVRPENIFSAMDKKIAEYRSAPHIGTKWEGVAGAIEREKATLEKQLTSGMDVHDLWKARSKFDEGFNKSAHLADPHALPVEAQMATRTAIEEEVRRSMAAIEKASPSQEGLLKGYLNNLKEYTILSKIGEAGASYAAHAGELPAHSIAKGVGLGLLTSFHSGPLGIATAVASPFMEQQVRERGAIMAAKTLKAIVNITNLRNAAAKGSSEIEGAIKRRFLDTNEVFPGKAYGFKVVKPVNLRPPRVILGTKSGESDKDAYLRHTDEVKKLAADPQEIARRLTLHMGTIHEDAPETAGLMMDHSVNAIKYLAGIANQSNDGRDPHSPTAHLEPRRVSDKEVREYAYKAMGALYPKETINAWMDGTAPKSSVEALKTVWPQMYKQTHKYLLEGLGSVQKPLTVSQRRMVTSVTGIPAGYSQSSSFIAFSQELHGGIDNQEEQQHAAGKVRKTKDLQRPFETTMQSLAQK